MAPKIAQKATKERLSNSKIRKGPDIRNHEFPAIIMNSQYISSPSKLPKKNYFTYKAPQIWEGEKDEIAIKKEYLVKRMRHRDACKRDVDGSLTRKNRSPNGSLTPTVLSRKSMVLRDPPPPTPPTTPSVRRFPLRKSARRPPRLSTFNQKFPPSPLHKAPPATHTLTSSRLPKTEAASRVQANQDLNKDKNTLKLPTEIEETLRKLDNFIKQIQSRRTCLDAHFLMKEEEREEKITEAQERVEDVPPEEELTSLSCEVEEPIIPQIKRPSEEHKRFHPRRLAEVHTTPLVGKRSCATAAAAAIPKTSTTRNRRGFVLAAPISNENEKKKKKNQQRVPKSVWED